jgi:hypothetical protein
MMTTHSPPDTIVCQKQRLLRDGKVESDQQYRGFRWWNKGGGSRTGNNHFTRDVLRADGTRAYICYGVDSFTWPCAA